MRLLVINPNTTASMTRKIGEAAKAVASPSTEVTAVNPAHGPVSIEGFYDEAFCVPGLLEEVRKGVDEGYDGFLVACFGDPGLDACREISDAPVIGICEAAMHVASLVAHRFTVVTTNHRSVPRIGELAHRYGVERRCHLQAAGVTVLSLEEPGSEAQTKVEAMARRAVQEEGAEAVLLGCAGMADLSARLSERLGVPCIDGVAAGTKLLEALVGLGVKTSKALAYSPPFAKPYAGMFAPYAPKG